MNEYYPHESKPLILKGRSQIIAATISSLGALHQMVYISVYSRSQNQATTLNSSRIRNLELGDFTQAKNKQVISES